MIIMICHVCAPLLLIVLCCHTESYSALRSHGRLRHQHTTTTTSRQLSFSTSTSSTPLLRLLQHVDEPSRSELSRHPISRFISPIEDKLSSWDIPNWLTFSRIISIPLFMVTFLNGLNRVAFSIYVTSCATDYLDGYLARRWNKISALGTFLDPVADKLMVATALILLSSRFATSLYTVPVSLILCREIGVSALRERMAEKGRRDNVQVGYIGKLKTCFQMLSTSLLLLVVPNSSASFDLCINVFCRKKALIFTSGIVSLYASMLLTLLSGFMYLRVAWPSLREEGN